eukprot:102235_1
MYLKRFILFIVANSMLLLIWSMANYYHYIRSQLWSLNNDSVVKLQEISMVSDDAKNDAKNDTKINMKQQINLTPSPTLPNITYIIPSLKMRSSLPSSLSYYFNKSIIFMGMINNAETTLPHLLQQLNELTCLFNNTYFFFFESNSIDNTTNILNKWYNDSSIIDNNNKYCNDINININGKINKDNNHNVYKHIIYGDSIVQKDLNSAIKQRSNSTYTHKLTRVETFVPYRNMMIKQLFNLIEMENMNIFMYDYIFMIDLDVFEIDFITFLTELIECPTNIMCINGVDQYNDYRDSFATVEMSHNWIYRPFIFNKSEAYYDKARNVLRKKMPRHNQRYENVRSCFNGLASYKIDYFINGECKYYTNDDILLLKSHTNDKNQWIDQIIKLINWSSLKGIMFDNDSGFETNLCEHIAFHYCLSNIYHITLSIAKHTKLYYYPLAPPQTKEDRRAKRRRRRRASRRQQRKDIFIQH